jgi:GH24 family phage-related lysozyme (muramidase)
MNDTVRGFIDGLPIPGTSALAKLIDFAEFEFVKDSAPVIQGLRSLTINSDDLSVSQTLSSGLATTVLPVSVLRSLSSDSGNLPQQISRQALSFLKMWEPEVDSARATEVQRNIIQCVTSPLSPNQNDALVSLVYSIGVDAFKESTLLKLINQGEHNSVPSEIKKWVKVRRENGVADDPELVKRREAEAGLYQRVDTPVPLAQSLSGLPVRYAYRYSSPASLGAYSYAQNPVAAAGAAISIADAASIGLATVSVVQAQAAASQGSFTLTFDKAQRILTTAARLKMTGARAPRSQYRRRLFYIGISRLNAAEADVIIEWEGNAYGEIGTAIIRKNIPTSTEWSKSSANISIVKKDHIPEGGDPRVWPIRFHYDGTYDPWGNGLFEFQGDFEINAFGGLHFIVHEVAKRAAINFALVGKAEDYVQKGDDVMVPVPSIPEEQLRYLKENLP